MPAPGSTVLKRQVATVERRKAFPRPPGFGDPKFVLRPLPRCAFRRSAAPHVCEGRDVRKARAQRRREDAGVRPGCCRRVGSARVRGPDGERRAGLRAPSHTAGTVPDFASLHPGYGPTTQIPP